MNMNRSTLLRYLTPGMIVALVLGFSLVVPAAANDDHSKQCGYGYGYGHTDNESQQGENHESQQAEINDEPCGEVEGDVDGNHGADKAEKADDSGVQAVSAAVHSQGGGGGHDAGERKKKGGGDD